MYFPTQHILMSNNVLCVKENTSLQVTYKKLGENYQHFYCRFKKKTIEKKNLIQIIHQLAHVHTTICVVVLIFLVAMYKRQCPAHHKNNILNK